jgi:hypothetical protein
MKSVGVVTMFGNQNWNFGAQLQAFALQRVIAGLGFECKVIDVDIELVRLKRYVFFKPLYMIRDLLRKKEKNNNFEIDKVRDSLEPYFIGFQTIIPHTEKYFSNTIQENCGSAFDYYVTGSDQVWNVGRFTYYPEFFLDFVTKGKPRISYAASIANDRILFPAKAIFRRYLPKFDHISVREIGAVNLLSPITDKPIKCVIDPSLLLSQNDYDDILIEPDFKESYILTYFLDETSSKNVIEFAHENGLKVVTFVRYQHWFAEYENYADKVIHNSGPREFVGWIKRAKYIITSSFHGTALSIIMHKRMACVASAKRDGSTHLEYSRPGSILLQLGLQSRLKPAGWLPALAELDEHIEWDSVEQKLSHLRSESLTFLKDALDVRTDI